MFSLKLIANYDDLHVLESIVSEHTIQPTYVNFPIHQQTFCDGIRYFVDKEKTADACRVEIMD